jgi:hypothetical protein
MLSITERYHNPCCTGVFSLYSHSQVTCYFTPVLKNNLCISRGEYHGDHLLEQNQSVRLAKGMINQRVISVSSMPRVAPIPICTSDGLSGFPYNSSRSRSSTIVRLASFHFRPGIGMSEMLRLSLDPDGERGSARGKIRCEKMPSSLPAPVVLPPRCGRLPRRLQALGR